MSRTIFFLFISLNIYPTVYGQDTIFYNKEKKETLLKEEAIDFKVLFKDSKDPDKVVVRSYYESGAIETEFPYSSYEDKIAHGIYRTWFEDGPLRSEKHFENGTSHGLFRTYWKNGVLKREDHYKKGKRKKGFTWDESGKEVPYYEYEIKPEFPGGKNALVKYLQANARRPKGVEGGKVIVGFVVDRDGTVTDVRIEKSSSLGLNLTAYNVVANMPAWKPGRHDGNIVRVKYSLPLVFR